MTSQSQVFDWTWIWAIKPFVTYKALWGVTCALFVWIPTSAKISAFGEINLNHQTSLSKLHDTLTHWFHTISEVNHINSRFLFPSILQKYTYRLNQRVRFPSILQKYKYCLNQHVRTYTYTWSTRPSTDLAQPLASHLTSWTSTFTSHIHFINNTKCRTGITHRVIFYISLLQHRSLRTSLDPLHQSTTATGVYPPDCSNGGNTGTTGPGSSKPA